LGTLDLTKTSSVFVARNGVCSFGEFKFVEDTLKIVCDQKIFKGCSVKTLTKTVARVKALCKFFQIFPPKDLVYIGRKIVTPFYQLNDFYLTN